MPDGARSPASGAATGACMPADRFPACSCASSVLRDSTAQGCRGHHRQLSPAAAAPHRDTASCQGSASRTPRCVLLRASLDAASPQRGWLTCASVLQPLEQWPLYAGRRRGVSWSARQQEQEPSLRPAQACHEPCTLCCRPAAHTGRPCTQSLCTAQTALSSTSIHRMTVSAAMACRRLH